jgi:hypothetical protein
LTRFKTEQFKWYSLPAEIEKRINIFADYWRGTPYMPGVRVKGVGVDCAQLVPSFLDFMYQNEGETPIPRMSGDVGVHNHRAAWGTVKAVRLGYPSFVVRDNTIEPGDIIITRSTADWEGPARHGHAMIAMPMHGTALHAIPLGGVTVTSLAVTRGGIVRVYRLKEKHRWA